MIDLLQVIDIAVIVADHEGKVVFWNKGAVKTFHYDPLEIVGMPLSILMPERYREAHNMGIQQMNSSEAVLSSSVLGKTTSLFGLRKNGEEFSMEIFLASYKEDEKNCFLAIINEIPSGSVEITDRMSKAMIAINQTMISITDKIDGAAKPKSVVQSVTLPT